MSFFGTFPSRKEKTRKKPEKKLWEKIPSLSLLTIVLGAEAVEGRPEDVYEVPLGAQKGEERVVVCVEVVTCFVEKKKK